jgi:pyruvate dehydrogenase E1 component
MDSMFPTAKIYSPFGQTYESVDRNLLLAYKESEKGQLLHEGISEAGAMGSMIAAATSYATHGEPMIPFYIFYSMFGFQRTGDQLWAMGDQLGRGFLIGATAGRTTLTGEGLQHADGHSPLLASSNPAAVHYDPAFSYEVAYIVKDGLRRMYGYGLDKDKPYGEDVFYYLTVYNEPVPQPAEPENLDVAALLKGIYRFSEYPTAAGDDVPRAQLLASGVALPWVRRAQQILAEEYSVAADIWSVTSWNELRREAIAVEQHNLLHPDEDERVPFITQQLKDSKGPVIAVSDYMRAVQDQISRWVPNDFTSLGTDGWGLADTRAAARRHFQVDAESIVVATLEALAKRGDVKREVAAEAATKYRIDDPTAVAGVKQEGAGA